MLTIGLQALYIACSDTLVIVINFPKSKTHAITDTYCTLLLVLLLFYFSIYLFFCAFLFVIVLFLYELKKRT